MWSPKWVLRPVPVGARGTEKEDDDVGLFGCLDGPERQGHGSLATTRIRGPGRARWRYHPGTCCPGAVRYEHAVAGGQGRRPLALRWTRSSRSAVQVA